MNKPIRHIAIIMDGNGRWAEQHHLAKAEGHRAGARKVSEIMQAAKEAGIQYLTLYAFSTENWKRSITEVTALMGLLEEFLTEKLPEFQKENVQLRTIGRTADLYPGARKKLKEVMEATKNNTGGVLTLALSYGGRAEIVDAVNRILSDTENNGKVTEESFSQYLYAPDIPDPDLMIRTSGEMRLSNFMLWQLSYSEFFVTDTLWPDFSKNELFNILERFQNRERRFGGRLK